MAGQSVIINDVGPRDGLQNQARVLEPAQRIQLIQALVDAGLKAVEVGAFVSPKAVPAMASTDQVVAGLPQAAVDYSALIPNQRGYELALAAGVETMNLVIAASNTMNEKNIRMSTEAALEVCEDVIALARGDRVRIQVYIATAWACPFEGAIAAQSVLDLAERLFAKGASDIVIADTIGAADPAAAGALMQALVKAHGQERLSCHFHDTRGMGVANVYAAAQAGIRRFDASIGGLGGCPFAPGATGNVATEDVVLMLEQMGLSTGIDLNKLVSAVELAQELTGHCPGGHALRWLKSQREKGCL